MQVLDVQSVLLVPDYDKIFDDFSRTEIINGVPKIHVTDIIQGLTKVHVVRLTGAIDGSVQMHYKENVQMRGWLPRPVLPFKDTPANAVQAPNWEGAFPDEEINGAIIGLSCDSWVKWVATWTGCIKLSMPTGHSENIALDHHLCLLLLTLILLWRGCLQLSVNHF